MQKWESEHNKLFHVNGMRFPQYIVNQWDDFHYKKEEQKQSRVSFYFISLSPIIFFKLLTMCYKSSSQSYIISVSTNHHNHRSQPYVITNNNPHHHKLFKLGLISIPIVSLWPCGYHSGWFREIVTHVLVKFLVFEDSLMPCRRPPISETQEGNPYVPKTS